MPNNILITPGSASIQFSGSAANTIRLQTEQSGSVAFYGTSGSLFSITDQLSGSLMSVNDVSGLPILEVFSDDRVVMGTLNSNALVVTGSRVGIGTSPANIFHVKSSGELGRFETTASTGSNYITFRDANAIKFQLGYTSPVNENFEISNLKNGIILFATNGIYRAQIPAAGGFQVSGSISVGDAVPVTSGAGITFPATQNASSNANTLDDYEEGTWTMNVNAGSLSSQSCKYVKVGTMVTLTIDFVVGTGGATGFTGLPFTCTTTVGTAPYTSGQNWDASYTVPTIVIATNDGYFRQIGDNVAFSQMSLTANAVYHAVITYFV